MQNIGASKYGMIFTPSAAAEPVADAASNGAVAPAAPAGFVGSPMFWLLAIAGTTLGLIGGSTSARIGPFSASVSAGAA